MKKKGQSALEYLLTYGWALIVIVIVIAAAVTLIPKPAPVCTGFDKLIISNHNLTSSVLQLSLTNATGRSITNTNFNAIFLENGAQVADVNYSAGNLQRGENISITLNPNTTLEGDIRVNITATYYDGEFNRVEKANCSGAI